MRRIVVILIVIAILFTFTTVLSETDRTSGLFTYRLKGNGNAVITGFNWKENGENDIYIPQLIDGYTVTEIGQYAFSISGKEFSYENNDTLIGYEVAVIIPNTVTKISEKAFYYTKVLSVIIPTSVKVIEGGAFAGCRNILQYTVEKGNETFTTIDGVLYNKKEKELIAFPTNISRYFQARSINDNVFYVPNGIVSIASYAFYDINRTKGTIALPSTLQSVGEHAFEHSSLSIIPVNEVNKLASKNYYTIMLPQSVNTIGEFSFAYCMGISWDRYRIFLNDSTLTEIPNHAFYMSSIERVALPDTLETIGESAFEAKSTGTSTIVIPQSVKKIADCAFRGVNFIVEFDENSVLSEIGKRAFFGSIISNKEQFILPDSLKSIGDEAFFNSISIGFIELTVPKSVKEIGDNVCDRTKVTLNVEEDTYAYFWAEENGYVIANNDESDTSWLNN